MINTRQLVIILALFTLIVGLTSVFAAGDDKDNNTTVTQPADPEGYPWLDEDYVVPVYVPHANGADKKPTLTLPEPHYPWDEGAAIQPFLPANNS